MFKKAILKETGFEFYLGCDGDKLLFSLDGEKTMATIIDWKGTIECGGVKRKREHPFITETTTPHICIVSNPRFANFTEIPNFFRNSQMKFFRDVY